MSNRSPEHAPRKPTAEEYARALRITRTTAHHSCVHCQYADCNTSILRSDAHDIVWAYERGGTVDPSRNYALHYTRI